MVNQTFSGKKNSADRSAHTFRLRLGKNLVFRSNSTIVLLWSVTGLLIAFGLVMVLSSSSITSYAGSRSVFDIFSRQGIYTLFGIPLMIIVSRFSPRFMQKWAWPVLGIGIAAQLLVFTGLGVEVGGNRNWVDLGAIRVQPSEFLKLAMIIWMGTVLQAKKKLPIFLFSF